jgi:hypothetical protein
VNHVKKSQSADFTRKGAVCGNTERYMLYPEKTQWRIPLKKKFAGQATKTTPCSKAV